jgi:hypothetical protein
MVLRSGRTPGRTPMRHAMMVTTPGSGNSDMSMGIDLNWAMSPGRVAASTTDLLSSLNQEAAGIMDNLESLSAGPDNLGVRYFGERGVSSARPAAPWRTVPASHISTRPHPAPRCNISHFPEHTRDGNFFASLLSDDPA